MLGWTPARRTDRFSSNHFCSPFFFAPLRDWFPPSLTEPRRGCHAGEGRGQAGKTWTAGGPRRPGDQGNSVTLHTVHDGLVTTTLVPFPVCPLSTNPGPSRPRAEHLLQESERILAYASTQARARQSSVPETDRRLRLSMVTLWLTDSMQRCPTLPGPRESALQTRTGRKVAGGIQTAERQREGGKWSRVSGRPSPTAVSGCSDGRHIHEFLAISLPPPFSLLDRLPTAR